MNIRDIDIIGKKFNNLTVKRLVKKKKALNGTPVTAIAARVKTFLLEKIVLFTVKPVHVAACEEETNFLIRSSF